MTILGLKEILDYGSVNTDLVKKTVTWTSSTDKVERTADVFIVSNVSFASADRIYSISSKDETFTQMVRAVTERIRLGETGTEALTKEQAAGLDPALGIALLHAVLEYDKEKAPELEAEAVKN